MLTFAALATTTTLHHGSKKNQEILKNEIMDRKYIEENIIKIIRDEVSYPLEIEISLSDNLFTIIGLDSLDYVEVIMNIEKFFDVYVSDDSMDRFSTAKELVDFVVESKNQ